MPDFTLNKVCSICRKTLDISQFYRNPKIIPDGIRKHCKGCRNEYRRRGLSEREKTTRRTWNQRNKQKINESARQKRAADPKRFKGYSLKRDYGLTLDEYDSMLAEQGNLCAICIKPEPGFLHGKRRALAVDHDKHTGKVRGLLCWPCNSGIGKLDHDIETLASAIDYLKKAA